MVLKGASEIAAGMTAQVPQVHTDCDRCAAQIVVGAPLGPTNRWRPYAVAMIDQAIRRHPGMDLYAARLRARRALIPHYLHGGKVWLSP